LLKPPAEGGVVNLPAMLVIVLLGALLVVGIRSSARANAIIVAIKLAAIAIFILVAAGNVDTQNWSPFMPFGWQGIMHGAALIFFAYIGFDAVSTAAEEANNPQRDLPIGIIASLGICTAVYILVAGLLTGIAPYHTLNVPSPVSDALLNLGYRWAGGIIAVGAIAGLTSVMLVLYYGVTRVLLAMSRDGLLPPILAAVHARTRTPVVAIVGAGLIMATTAGFTPIGTIAELVNIGTLSAFLVVCLGVVVLRRTQPDLHRPFRTPLSPMIPLLGVAACAYLMSNLPVVTWLRYLVWMALGLVVYGSYSMRRSALNRLQQSE
jgi:APA family basic amino acid/polyamine antiporter